MDQMIVSVALHQKSFRYRISICMKKTLTLNFKCCGVDETIPRLIMSLTQYVIYLMSCFVNTDLGLHGIHFENAIEWFRYFAALSVYRLINL